MTDIKSQVLTEVEQIGGNVIAVADAMEKCPTLAAMIANSCIISGGVSTGFALDKPLNYNGEDYDIGKIPESWDNSLK